MKKQGTPLLFCHYTYEEKYSCLQSASNRIVILHKIIIVYKFFIDISPILWYCIYDKTKQRKDNSNYENFCRKNPQLSSLPLPLLYRLWYLPQRRMKSVFEI